MEQMTEAVKAEKEASEVLEAEPVAAESSDAEGKEQDAAPQAEAEKPAEIEDTAAPVSEAEDTATEAAEDAVPAGEESKIQAVAEKLASLEKLFEARIAYTTFEEQSRVNMHKELQNYKEGMYGRIMQPLLMDIISLREDMLKTVTCCEKKASEEQHIPLADFAAYANQDLSWLLEKYDVNSYQSEAGSEFSAHKHKTAKTVPTEDESQQGKIAYSLSNGYEYDGRVIYSERVARYVYNKPQVDKVEEEK